MNDERWQQTVDMAKKNFQDVSLTTEELIRETQDGPIKQGTQDILIFKQPSGCRKRLIRENKPVVLEKKEHYSHRMGDTARTEYKFSETEFSHRLRVYKESGFEDWDEITLDKLGL